MKRKTLPIVILLVLASMLLGLAACGGQESTEINVLCTPQEEWCQGMKQEFEDQFGITVNYVRMSSGESLARIRAEKDNPQFDIWWGGPIDSFVAAKGEGLLEQYDSPNMKNLRDQEKFKDADNYWAGIYVGTLGFCTNEDWLAQNPGVEPPKSWDDLLKPEFTGQVLVAHPSTSGTSYTALSTVLQIRGQDAGWEYLRKYAGQMLQFTKSGAAPAKFVGQGEAGVCIVFSHDIVHEIEDNAMPLVLSFPEEGTGYEIGSMSIIDGARNLDEAKKFHDWALSAEAQNLALEVNAFQVPSNKGAKTSPSAPDMSTIKLIDYDFKTYGSSDERKRLLQKWDDDVSTLPQ